ncbi:MAG: zf-HC2 domain-containing protein [Planctomycetota bacterium]
MNTATPEISHFCRYVPEPSLRAALHGTLPAEQARVIETHVRDCPHCAAQLATLAQGELFLASCASGHPTAHRFCRSPIFLMLAAAAGVGIALVLKALIG